MENNNIKFKIDLDFLEEADRAMKAVAKSLNVTLKSKTFVELSLALEEAARQQRWAKDPLELMPFLDIFSIKNLRRNASETLHNLADWIDNKDD